MNTAGEREAHDAGVINRDDENGESAEEIETGLAFTIREARIDLGGWRDTRCGMLDKKNPLPARCSNRQRVSKSLVSQVSYFLPART
jgi:hypothetical protein